MAHPRGVIASARTGCLWVAAAYRYDAATMRFVRPILLASIALLAVSPPAALADDPPAPRLSVQVASPFAWWGSTVTLRVTANVPGRVAFAQSRRYASTTPGGGSCGWEDKYFTDRYGVHGPYLPGRTGSVPPAPPAVVPGKTTVITFPATALEFGAGDFPWAKTETWPGCRTRWTQYDRLSVYFVSDTGGQPGGSYFNDTERSVALTRLF